ncbi:MAG: OmpA family protein [Spirochaetaceae bacterium]|nr:MAG: OmpA family protein [Spirochaetaceae bacterium]
MRSILRTLLPVILGFIALNGPAAQENVLFQYSHREGEQYRIVGVNRQEITLNGEYLGEAEVLTRVLITLQEDRQIHARYQVSEESDVGNEVFAVDREYDVTFRQEPSGEQIVSSASFVPQVQNVPRFPREGVGPGDSWDAPGLEVYDFREGLALDQPVRIPIQVNYEYLGGVEKEGRRYEEIRIRYNLFHRPRPGAPEAEEIRLITARFTQRLLWDLPAGRPAYYDEEYNLFIQLADGNRMEYRGTADGRVVDAPDLNRDRVREDIAQSILDLAIPDTTVRSDEDGVTIGLEDIRFAPDSAELLESELVKLEWVASILRRYPDRDVLITGHTALAGTAEGRQRLSEERAAAVGQFLLDQGVRTRDSLMYRGRGAEDPVATNDTPEGRRRNRRVEITILEN